MITLKVIQNNKLYIPHTAVEFIGDFAAVWEPAVPIHFIFGSGDPVLAFGGQGVTDRSTVNGFPISEILFIIFTNRLRLVSSTITSNVL